MRFDKPLESTVCQQCGKRKMKTRTDEGTFKPCRACGGTVKRSNYVEERRMARARAELAALDR